MKSGGRRGAPVLVGRREFRIRVRGVLRDPSSLFVERAAAGRPSRGGYRGQPRSASVVALLRVGGYTVIRFDVK